MLVMGRLSDRAAWGAAFGLLLVHVGLLLWGSEADGPAVSAAAARQRFDPNTVSAAELELLPGVGPTLAQYIVEYREAATKRPVFVSAEELTKVKRIGLGTAERLAPYWRFAGGGEGHLIALEE